MSPSPSNSKLTRVHSYPLSPCSNVKRHKLQSTLNNDSHSSPLKAKIPHVSFYLASDSSSPSPAAQQHSHSTPRSPPPRPIGDITEPIGIPDLNLLYGAGPVVEYPTSPTSEKSFRRSMRKEAIEHVGDVRDVPTDDDNEGEEGSDEEGEVLNQIELELDLFKEHISDVKTSISRLENFGESLQKKLNLLRKNRYKRALKEL